MSLTLAFLSWVLASGPMSQQAQLGTRRYRLLVPREVASRPTYLLVRCLAVPRNRPIVLRAYALGNGHARVFLGSAGIPGFAPDAQGVTSMRELRIDVTSGLRRWVASAASAESVDVEIAPFGRDTTVQLVEWSARSVEFVHPS